MWFVNVFGQKDVIRVVRAVGFLRSCMICGPLVVDNKLDSDRWLDREHFWLL